MRTTRYLPAPRRGFTLVELLVVIAIIGLLAALMSAGVMRMLGQPPQKNTEMMIQKLTASIEQQWAATIAQARNEPIPDVTWTQCLAAAGQERNDAIEMYVKARLLQEFGGTQAPRLNATGGGITVNFASAKSGPTYNGVILPPKTLFTNGLTGAAPANSPARPNGGGNNGYESAIVLYLAMTASRGGMEFNTSNLSPKEFRDLTDPKTGNTTYRTFVDGWGDPVKFEIYEAASKDLVSGASTAKTVLKFRIISAGADGAFGTGDDVKSDVLLLGH